MIPPEIAAYLRELTCRLDGELGPRLAGAWLTGSGALGDFDPARSDVDVQAVTTGRLARHELERLGAALSHPALRCPVRGLEFVLYLRGDAPRFQLNLNSGPRMEQRVGYNPRAEPRFFAHRADRSSPEPTSLEVGAALEPVERSLSRLAAPA